MMDFVLGRSTKASRCSRLLAVTAIAAFATPLLASGAAAHAQGSGRAQTYDFDIPAQSLSRSINHVASQANVQVLYSGDDTRDINAPALKGRMTVGEALSRLLAGTGYTYRYSQPGVITLVKLPKLAEGERVTGAVRVEGLQGSPYFGGAGVAAGVNGINGSRDITATEGTGSFTSGALTIGSKVPQAMKDVPQSISVLTAERLEQQNVTDFTTAMKQLPGITLVQGANSLENTFYSRGFTVTSIQVDGGGPLSTSYGFFPQIDMSIYDHVELLRGAAGQFNGYGNPSGTVNLVRKKPLDHAQMVIEAQAGSWSNYRVVADASSPLGLDGKLRGRLVMTYQDNRHFYDTAKDNKTLVYGIAELDMTPTTLVTAGLSYTRQDSAPWQGGLPRYLKGDDLELPRSTSFAFPWNRWDFDTTEIFGGVEQQLGNEWTAKLNFTHNRQRSTRKLGRSYGAIDPESGTGAVLAGTFDDYASKQLSVEGVVSGAFSLLGQRQEITIGINRVSSDGGGRRNYNFLTESALPIDVFNFDPRDQSYNEPANPLPYNYSPIDRAIQSVAYANLRLTAFDRVHLTSNVRWSRFERKAQTDTICWLLAFACEGMSIGDVYYTSNTDTGKSVVSWPPAMTLSFDVTRSLTSYIGYTDIYLDQSYLFTAEGEPLGPVTGGNWEAGVKWAPREGRLNLSASIFSIDQKGQGRLAGPYQDLGNGRSCCWLADDNMILRSQGLDLEATGEILPGWQVAASYTFNDRKYAGSSVGEWEGKPFATIAPKHVYKLWTSYDFGASGSSSLSGLTLSGGVNGQSSAYYSGSVCHAEMYVPFPSTPFYKVCSEPEVPFEFIVPPYAVVAARLDYRFSAKWSLALNLDNILDKTYYQSVGGSVQDGNWYGAPRSITATLRAKW